MPLSLLTKTTFHFHAIIIFLNYRLRVSAAHLITYPSHNTQKTHSKVLDSPLPEETVQAIQVIRISNSEV